MRVMDTLAGRLWPATALTVASLSLGVCAQVKHSWNMYGNGIDTVMQPCSGKDTLYRPNTSATVGWVADRTLDPTYNSASGLGSGMALGYQVNLRNGLTGFGIKYATPQSPRWAAVKLDSLNTMPICTLYFRATGAWGGPPDSTYVTLPAPVASGHHRVWLHFGGGSGIASIVRNFWITMADPDPANAENWTPNALPAAGDSVVIQGTTTSTDSIRWNLNIAVAYFELLGGNVIVLWDSLKAMGIDTFKVDQLNYRGGKMHLPADFVVQAQTFIFKGTPKPAGEYTSASIASPFTLYGEGKIIAVTDVVGVHPSRTALLLSASRAHAPRMAHGAISVGVCASRLALCNASGRTVRMVRNAAEIPAHDLTPGSYTLRAVIAGVDRLWSIGITR